MLDWFSTPIPGTNCCSPGGRWDHNWYCGHPCEQLTTAGWAVTIILSAAMLIALIYVVVGVIRLIFTQQ